ncbi:MAG: tetratricopeptide repeat protein [Lentisphaeria bacterium]|nr:tetratricopeptide repeat protein [Lentisphaeria bacterium]
MNVRNLLLAAAAVCFIAALRAAPSPWDSWRAGYTSFEQGESLYERGRYSEAAAMFEKARQHYLAVRAARPDWNQRVIADRLHDCDTRLAETRRLLNGGAPEKTAAAASTEGPEPKKSAPAPDAAPPAASSGITVAEHSAVIQELYQVKAELEQARKSLGKQRDLEAEISALLRDKRVAEEKVALMEKRYQALVARQNEPDARLTELEQRLLREKLDSERYRRRLSASEQQVAELQEQLKEARLRVSAADTRLQRAADELKRRENELREKTDALARRESELAAADTRAAATDNRAAAAVADMVPRRQMDDLVGMFQRTKKELELREKETVSLKEELRRQQAESRIGAAELADLRRRNHALEEDVKLLSERGSELKARLERRDREDFQAAASANAARAKLEGDLLALQKELVALRGDTDVKTARIAEAGNRVKALEAELIASRARAARFEETGKRLSAAEGELNRVRAEFARLQRDFTALSAENRENRLLAAAAKPREKELETAKLRLLEMDRLKNELAREQRLGSELKAAYRKDQQELRSLRSRVAELDSLRRKLAELEPAAREAARLKEVERELERVRGREAELAALKIREGELAGQLRTRTAAEEEARRELRTREREVAELRSGMSELERLKRNNAELEALLAGQTAELDRMKRQLDLRTETSRDAAAAESEKFRKLAARIGELNDQLRHQSGEAEKIRQSLTARLDRMTGELDSARRTLELRDKELTDLKKINAELADYRRNSVEALRNKVDVSRITRLEDELTSLSRINAELAAERDRLQAERERTAAAETPVKAVLPGVSPEQAASSGVIAESDGNRELAIWNYRQALAVAPDFAPAHLRLGMILFGRGSFAEAMPHVSAALAADPDNLDLALTAARCQLALKRYGDAGAIVEPLLARRSDNAVVQMCAAMIDAGSGRTAQAEDRLRTAIRLAPGSAEIHLELARLLSTSLNDRRSEAVLAYEQARALGAAPDPELEKTLGGLLDHRRETMRFLREAAREAELGGDWRSAVWYYRKLVGADHPEFVPYLALAQWKSGNASGAKETLEFHPPSRTGMAVRTLIALAEEDDAAAMSAARQSIGAKIDPTWAGMGAELERLRSAWRKPTAAKLLLESVKR